MDVKSDGYPSLVKQLVKSLVKDAANQAECCKNVHDAVLHPGSYSGCKSDEDLVSSASLLHQLVFILSQRGYPDKATKLTELFSKLEEYDRKLWDDGLKLLCLLASSNEDEGCQLRRIGENSSDALDILSGDDEGRILANLPSCSRADLLGSKVKPYSEPDVRPFHLRRGTGLETDELSAGLVSLYPGSGLKRAFSNSEENNLMGAMCLQPPPFSSLLRGRFVLDVPDLPSHPRPLTTTSSLISTTSTGISLEDEGYSTRPTTPNVKPVEKFADWESAANSEYETKTIVRKVNQYQLKLIRNQVDVYVDDVLFGRCVRCLLSGLQSEIFSFNDEQKTFIYPPRTSLLGVRIVIFQRFCQSLINIGNCVRELNCAIDEARVITVTLKESFWSSLRMQLDEVLRSVPDFAETKSLVKFAVFAKGVHDTVKLFCYLARIAKSDSCNSLDLLSEISQAINLLTTNEHMLVCLHLLISCCDPLMKLFAAWLYGKSDCKLEGFSIRSENPLTPVISQSILDSIQKIGENVSLLRSISPLHELANRNRPTPEVRLLTSNEEIVKCDFEIERYLDSYEQIFLTDLSLDESQSPELELVAREARQKFFERIQEEKRQNDEMIRERKVKEFEEKKKAMNEEIERKKIEKANYLSDMPVIKVESVAVALDNADVINANIGSNANCRPSVSQANLSLNTTGPSMYESFTSVSGVETEHHRESPNGTLFEEAETIDLVPSQDVKNSEETVFQNAEIADETVSKDRGETVPEKAESIDKVISKEAKNSEETAFRNAETPVLKVEVETISDRIEIVDKSMLKNDEKADEAVFENAETINKNTLKNAEIISKNALINSDETVFENAETLDDFQHVSQDLRSEEVKFLVQTCNKELPLGVETTQGGVTPYLPLRLKSEVLGLSRQAPVIVSLEDFRNTFINASDMIERSLLPHLNAQSKLVNRSLLNSIVCEYQLNEHIRGLRRFFLLYDGEFATALSTTLEQVGQVQSSAGVLALSSSLRHVLSQSIYGNTLAAGYLTLRVSAGEQSAKLSYRAPWPISLVLTEEVLGKYSKVNTLLLDLRRKSALMDKGLWKIFKAGRSTEDARRVAVIASSVHEASHVLNAVRRYFHCQAIEIGWNSLNKDWETIQTLDDLCRAHSRYIDGVLNRCLLMDSASTIKKVVDQVTSACVEVVRTGLDVLEGEPKKELVFMESFRKFRDATKILCIVVKSAASRHKSSYLAMFDLEVDFNNFFKSLKV